MNLVRSCYLCKRATKTFGVTPAAARELANSFAAAHIEHMEEQRPDWFPFRCGGCGILLLWTWRCPEHPYAERVTWTPDLARAYGSIVGAFAQGVDATYAPLQKATFDRAYGLARAWGMRKEVWLREKVRAE